MSADKGYRISKVTVDGKEVKFSTDAGKFVCNNLYFHLLIHCQNKALFIHIPECNDNIENYQKHAKTIEQIIQTIGGQ